MCQGCILLCKKGSNHDMSVSDLAGKIINLPLVLKNHRDFSANINRSIGYVIKLFIMISTKSLFYIKTLYNVSVSI